jgi:hypothetical protein
MGPAKQNLVVVAGDDETVEFVLTTDGTTPINITNRSYVMQVRQDPSATGAADAEFTCTVPTGTDGKVVCTASDTVTAALDASKQYSWSLLEVAGSVESTLLIGKVDVERQVAKN